MLVRAAGPGDAEGIATVHVRGWQRAYAHVFPAEKLAGLSIVQRTASWRERLERGTAALVAEREGEIVGFATVGPSRDEQGIGELYGIYVLPDAWDTGAGRALMERALDDLRAQGFDEATLWVLDDNPRARRFYERGGWKTDGSVKGDEFLGMRVSEVRYRISLR